MKLILSLLTPLTVFMFADTCQAQASLLVPNGGFELGDREEIPNAYWSGQLNPATALPSWSLSSPFLLIGNFLLDTESASFATSQPSQSIIPYSGNYSLVLHAGWGVGGFVGAPNTISLSQDLFIPSIFRSITFRGQHLVGMPLVVTLGGQPRAPLLISSNNGYELFAIDASDFRGSTAELKFSLSQSYVVTPDNQYFAPSIYALDDIRFSTLVVPEPSAFVLCGTGLIALINRRRR